MDPIEAAGDPSDEDAECEKKARTKVSALDWVFNDKFVYRLLDGALVAIQGGLMSVTETTALLGQRWRRRGDA